MLKVFWSIKYCNIKTNFKTLDAAVDYLMTLKSSDTRDFHNEKIDICQLFSDEIYQISEEDIDDSILSPVAPANVLKHLNFFN